MSSFNLIYNSLANKYRGIRLINIFNDFEIEYDYEYKNNDEYGFQEWIDLYTPVYRAYYLRRIEWYLKHRKTQTYYDCESVRLVVGVGIYRLIDFL